MTKRDRLAPIRSMHARGEELKRKTDSCVLVVLWIGLRIAVRITVIRTSIERVFLRSAQITRVLRQRTLARLVYPSIVYFFGWAVDVLSCAATIRARTILAGRNSRSAARASLDWKATRKPALRIAEAALWILAAGTLGYCGYAYASAALHQNHQKAAFKALQTEAEADPVLASDKQEAIAGSEPPVRGAVLGILDIPRIGLSSVVEQGVDSAILRDNVGHIPGTALPGQGGNAALAAHRDTYFRHLSELKAGDEIVFHSVSATYTYRVQSTTIVQPADTSVLNATKKPTLTLVTCFPFYYVGSAPKRFVLVARQDAVTDVASTQ